MQSLQAYREAGACRHLSVQYELSAPDTHDSALGTSTGLAGMSHVLGVPGTPKLTTVLRTMLISTAPAARLGQTERGGSFSIPMPDVPASPPTRSAPGYLPAHPPTSPTRHQVWPWHPGTTPLPALHPSWHRSHLPGWCENRWLQRQVCPPRALALCPSTEYTSVPVLGGTHTCKSAS